MPIVAGTGSERQAQAGDVPSLRKGLALLDLLASRGGLTMSEIQAATGLNKTMTFRLLRLLHELGYVERNPSNRHYELGLKLLHLGNVVSSRLDIISISKPVIDELVRLFDETVNLGILEDHAIIYVAMAERPHGLRMGAAPGSLEPVHSTSIGKVILAFLPRERCEAVVSKNRPLRRLTPYTIVDEDELRRELNQIRTKGYAIDHQENELGACCVGVPVLDGSGRSIAGLSVSGPCARLSDERIEALTERLWAASREISRRLGHSPNGEGVDRLASATAAAGAKVSAA
jgi:IclR family acetate operon transcriptional repressor